MRLQEGLSPHSNRDDTIKDQCKCHFSHDVQARLKSDDACTWSIFGATRRGWHRRLPRVVEGSGGAHPKFTTVITSRLWTISTGCSPTRNDGGPTRNNFMLYVVDSVISKRWRCLPNYFMNAYGNAVFCCAPQFQRCAAAFSEPRSKIRGIRGVIYTVR